MKNEKKVDRLTEPTDEVPESFQPDTEAEYAEHAEEAESKRSKRYKKKKEKSSEKMTAETKPDPELDVLRDKLLRLHADFDNYRKRVARDHSEMVKRSNETLVESLLPVLDHIGHAETMMSKNDDPSAVPYLEGFQMVKKELLKVLGDYGVEPIKTADASFDANLHDALTVQHSDTAESDTILMEVRRGYMLNGRVLRPSQVIVASDDSGAPVSETESVSETEADGE